MIVFKKVHRDFKEFILTLRVPESALTITKGDDVQASSVEIISAEDLNGNPVPHDTFHSMWDWRFTYKVGTRVDSDICRTRGIYCFKSKPRAVKFMARSGDPVNRKV